MTDLKGARIVVAGAGALGLATALTLARDGAQVILADPAGLGENASGVAAGMLAPAFEAALDAPSARHFLLLKAARDLWPAFADSLEDPRAVLDRSGALWVGDDGARIAQALRDLGAAVETGEGVYTPEDWRLEPAPMLRAMAAAAERAGVSRQARRVTAPAADALVLAVGFPSDAALAPELAHLQPIKGQLLAFEGGPSSGPVLRTAGGYGVPSAGGAVVGATMEPGLSDLSPDPAALARLRTLAASLFPQLTDAPFTPRVGIRAATPDGLPLVGPSARPGVILVCGARRNGWLLAPLVAEMVASYLAGGDGGEHAPALDARRFDRA